MECQEAETSAELTLDGENGSTEQAELDAHLARCERCRMLVARKGWYRRTLTRKLFDAATGTETPAALSAAIVAGIREADSGRSGWAWAAPAGGALVVVGLLSWFQSTTPPLDPEPNVSLHTRNLPPEVTVRRDHREVERFVRQNVRHPIRFPRAESVAAESAQVRLVGARLSQVDNREAVQLIYDQRGARISLFAHPRPGRFTKPPGFRVREAANKTLLLGQHRGYRVVSWYDADRDVLYSLVSDVDEHELTSLATSFDP